VPFFHRAIDGRQQGQNAVMMLNVLLTADIQRQQEAVRHFDQEAQAIMQLTDAMGA